jgi:hypothetical protein
MPLVDLMKNPKSGTVKASTRGIMGLVLMLIGCLCFMQFVQWLSSFERVPWYVFAIAMVVAIAIPEIYYRRGSHRE